MALIAQPPTTDVEKRLGVGWAEFFNNVFFLLNCLTQSGPTTERPVKLLFVGRTFFDTTLGLPIWYKNPGWVKADGTAA